MATSFIKKNWQKDATDVLIESAIRGAGGIGSAFVTKKVFKKDEKGGATLLYNLGGPILTAVGVLGDMMLADPKFKAFFQGMSTYGIMHSVAVLAPTAGEKMGISGLADAPEEEARYFNGVGALGTTTTENYEADIKALTAGQPAVNDTDGKTYNNDWAYLAQNIDNAEQITKTVNGTPEDAAALFGVATNEEAALMMGMF